MNPKRQQVPYEQPVISAHYNQVGVFAVAEQYVPDLGRRFKWLSLLIGLFLRHRARFAILLGGIEHAGKMRQTWSWLVPAVVLTKFPLAAIFSVGTEVVDRLLKAAFDFGRNLLCFGEFFGNLLLHLASRSALDAKLVEQFGLLQKGQLVLKLDTFEDQRLFVVG